MPNTTRINSRSAMDLSVHWAEAGLPGTLPFGQGFSAALSVPNAVIYLFDLTPATSTGGTQAYTISAAGVGALANGGSPVAGPVLRTIDNVTAALGVLATIHACEVVLHALPYTPEEAEMESPPSRVSSADVEIRQEDGTTVKHSAYLAVNAPGQVAHASWVLPAPATLEGFHSLAVANFVSRGCRVFGVLIGVPA